MPDERIRFTMSVDPYNRGRAYVTSHGSQGSFINYGDMYQMALRYASQLSSGRLEFIQKDGSIYNPDREWDSEKELLEVLGSDESRSIYRAYQHAQRESFAAKEKAAKLETLLRIAENRIAELHA